MWERDSGGGRGLEWHCENQGTKEMGGFPAGSAVKNPPAIQCNAGDAGLIPGSGRSPGERKGYPLQCSWTPLSDFHFHCKLVSIC